MSSPNLSALELLDRSDHDTPDLHRLPLGGDDVGEGGVRRLQLETATAHPELLAGELVVHHGDHDLSVGRLDRPVHQDDIAVKDPHAFHGVPTDGHAVGGLWMGDQAFEDVDAFGLKVLGR